MRNRLRSLGPRCNAHLALPEAAALLCALLLSFFAATSSQVRSCTASSCAQDAGPVQLHAAVEALQGLSAEAAELQARLAELATLQAAPLPEAVASTLEHLVRPPLALFMHITRQFISS